MKHHSSASGLLAAIVLIVTADAATAQTNCAVSEINGKVSNSGGNINSEASDVFNASISLPVTRHFGFQADALYSRIDKDDYFGGAAHLFWRDPQIGLLGLTGGYIYQDRASTYQIGFEGAYYFHRITFGFFAGVGAINSQYNVTPLTAAFPIPDTAFIDPNPVDFLGKLSVDYYPVDDLRVGASYATMFRESLFRGEVEYQTPLPGLALTSEVAVGNNGYDHWLVGLRYYFGSKKTLIDRQRQDDPPGLPQQLLEGLGLFHAKYNHKRDAFVRYINQRFYNPGNSGSTGGSGDSSGFSFSTATASEAVR
jgi:hypothetical protein